MLIVTALLAFAPDRPHPLAPAPHPARGWSARHVFAHKAPVRAVAATADGYATGDSAGVLLLWDAKTGVVRETLLDGTAETLKPTTAVGLAPDGKRLSVVANGSSCQITIDGKDRTFHGPNPLWTVVALAADGSWLATPRFVQPDLGGAEMLHVMVQEFAQNSISSRFPHRIRHPAAVRLAALARGFVSSVDVNGAVRGWKFQADQLIEREAWSVDFKRLGPTALAVSPDGTLVAVAGETGVVEILSARRGESVAALKGHAGAVRSVAFAPDSGLIATGGDDGTVRLWNPWSGAQEELLEGHSGPVAGVWFASDDVLLSASDDKTARVWVYKP
jgi:WD40 repeat protein